MCESLIFTTTNHYAERMHIVVCLDMSISTRMYARKEMMVKWAGVKIRKKERTSQSGILDNRLENLATYRAPTAAST
jgi:hypothetical protein